MLSSKWFTMFEFNSDSRISKNLNGGLRAGPYSIIYFGGVLMKDVCKNMKSCPHFLMSWKFYLKLIITILEDLKPQYYSFTSLEKINIKFR